MGETRSEMVEVTKEWLQVSDGTTAVVIQNIGSDTIEVAAAANGYEPVAGRRYKTGEAEVYTFSKNLYVRAVNNISKIIIEKGD